MPCCIIPNTGRADQRVNALRFPLPSLLTSSVSPQHQPPITGRLRLRKSSGSYRLTRPLLFLLLTIFCHPFLPWKSHSRHHPSSHEGRGGHLSAWKKSVPLARPITPEGIWVSPSAFSSVRDQVVCTIHPFPPSVLSSLARRPTGPTGYTGHHNESGRASHTDFVKLFGT